MIKENKKNLEMCRPNGYEYILIDKRYDTEIDII